MDEVEQKAYHVIETIFKSENASEDQMYRFLCYVQEHKSLFLVLLQRNGLSHFSAMLHTSYGEKWAPQGLNYTKTEEGYLYEFIYTGMLGVVQKWVRNGCLENPRKISKLIWNTLLHAVEND